jgi:hypothetical protein
MLRFAKKQMSDEKKLERTENRYVSLDDKFECLLGGLQGSWV